MICYCRVGVGTAGWIGKCLNDKGIKIKLNFCKSNSCSHTIIKDAFINGGITKIVEFIEFLRCLIGKYISQDGSNTKIGTPNVLAEVVD